MSTPQAEMAVMGHLIHVSIVVGGSGEGLLVSTRLAARRISTGMRAVSKLGLAVAIHYCLR